MAINVPPQLPLKCRPAAAGAGCGSALALGFLAWGGAAARADWPEFRGPRGDGHAVTPGGAPVAGLPLHWNETNNVKWKTPIPHRGWATPVVMGGQVWLTTATSRA